MIAKNIDVKLRDRAASGKAMHWKKNMIRW